LPPCEVTEVKVKNPEGALATQKNDDGLTFSIGLAEYSIAVYMKTVLEASASEVTIVAPNTLQRDLIREVYSKKRTVSGRFVEVAPYIISIGEVNGCLPLEYTIYNEVEKTDAPCWTTLKGLADRGQVSKLVKLTIRSKGKADANTVYREVRALLKNN